MTRVMVVAAHPDDEALGCAGTLAWHAARGDVVKFIFLADGVTSRDASITNEDAIEERRRMAQDACGVISTLPPAFACFPDNQMDSVPLLRVVHKIESLTDGFDPHIVYTHHAGDLNVDHRLTHQAVLTAFRPVPGSSVRAIYAFEVCSSTEWAPGNEPPMRPTRYVDVSDFLAVKKDMCSKYGKEMRPWPHARSWDAVEALARHRGAAVGLAAAEAFEVVREICADWSQP